VDVSVPRSGFRRRHDRFHVVAVPRFDRGYVAYDDARQVRGIWFFLDPVQRHFERFAVQSSVGPLFENPPIQRSIRKIDG
jgi:hypothetical protein